MDVVINQLQEIGLNKLEAEVYLLLLKEEPMTAYRIGRLLNKPTANIYKAADALSEKGALVIQSGSKNLCKAVPYEEFLKVLRSRFNSKTENLSKALANIERKERDEGIYAIESLELVFEKAKAMIDQCEIVLTLGVFPETFQKIEDNIQMAINRGVRVNLLTFGKTNLKGANIVLLPIKNEKVKTWKSQQLNLVVDGKESLISSFNLNQNQIYHASWSTSIYLASVLHGLFLREHTINKIMGLKDSPDKLKEIEAILNTQEFFHNSDVPGFKLLWERHKE